jgi:hypothetical protein
MIDCRKRIHFYLRETYSLGSWLVGLAARDPLEYVQGPSWVDKKSRSEFDKLITSEGYQPGAGSKP